MKRGLAGPTGLVSQLPQFQGLGLVDWDRLVIGGHEIRGAGLFDECQRMARESRHAALPGVVEACRDELEEIDRRIRPGTSLASAGRLPGWLTWSCPAMKRRVRRSRGCAAIWPHSPGREAWSCCCGQRGIDRAAVRRVGPADELGGIGELIVARTLRVRCGTRSVPTTSPTALLPASSLYAIAALEEGYSYINFTPSLGASPAAIDELPGFAALAITVATARRARR